MICEWIKEWIEYFVIFHWINGFKQIFGSESLFLQISTMDYLRGAYHNIRKEFEVVFFYKA